MLNRDFIESMIHEDTAVMWNLYSLSIHRYWASQASCGACVDRWVFDLEGCDDADLLSNLGQYPGILAKTLAIKTRDWNSN